MFDRLLKLKIMVGHLGEHIAFEFAVSITDWSTSSVCCQFQDTSTLQYLDHYLRLERPSLAVDDDGGRWR